MQPGDSDGDRRLQRRRSTASSKSSGPNYRRRDGPLHHHRARRRDAAAAARAARLSARAARRPPRRRSRPTASPSSICSSASRRRTAAMSCALWYKPYVTLIWLGCVLMAAAGFLSLTDRRLRVGAPRRAARAGRRRMRTLLALLTLLLAGVPALGGAARTRCWPIRRSRRAPARSRTSCAASSARTSRSTTAMPTWPARSALIVRERLVAGDTDAAGAAVPRRSLWRVRAAATRWSRRTRCCCGSRRRWCW